MEKNIRLRSIRKYCNRAAYISFLLIASVFLYLENYPDAMMYLGLAFIFDPFDSSVTYKDRPLYQRLWLLVHLAVTLLVLAIMLLRK